MKEALSNAVALAKQFEGFRSEPYLCPAGVATIGYGSTSYLDGRKVTLEDRPVSKAEAELLLIQVMTAVCASVLKASPIVLGNANAWAALADFVYNLGISRYRSSTLKRRVDAQDFAAAGVELLRWTRAGGRVLPGLVKRRQAEWELMLR